MAQDALPYRVLSFNSNLPNFFLKSEGTVLSESPGFTSFAGGFGANFSGVLLFPSFPLFLLLFAFYKNFYNLSAAQLDDLRLPNGDVNYIQLFQDNALPNPICVWYNGTNHYEPITLVCPFFILS